MVSWMNIYEFRKFVGNIQAVGAAREQGIEVIYVQHDDDGPDTGFSVRG